MNVPLYEIPIKSSTYKMRNAYNIMEGDHFEDLMDMRK
jgi:hypothetical protein